MYFYIPIVALFVAFLLYHRFKNTKKIKYLIFDSRAIIPKRATDGSVGYDIYTYQDILLEPNTTTKIPTGFGIKLPSGYYPEIHARSSLSIGHTTIGAGIIDEDYTGEISVIFANMTTFRLVLKAGSAIAQFKIHNVVKFDAFEIVTNLPMTKRSGGFGSTN